MNRPSIATAPSSRGSEDVTLAILAGGAGSRMGQPKGLIEIDGRPILVDLLERISWTGPTLLVTSPGREHPPGWAEFHREVVDPVAGQGPLRGVLTALEHAATDVLVVAVGDMPGVTRGHLEWLAIELGAASGALALMLRRGEQVEPFPSAYRRGAADMVAAQLVRGRHAVHGLAVDDRVLVRPAPDWPELAWTNLNRPADLEAYLRTCRPV